MRVLVVDDSALMRKHLVGILGAEPDIEVQIARNGAEAIERLMEFEPDVITLDINMPELDGLSALSLIMLKRPTPVVMVSSLTHKGATATLEALALGAVDFIPKPEGTISLSVETIREQVVSKVRAAASAKIGCTTKRQAPRWPTSSSPKQAAEEITPSDDFPIVIIGVSTGGPRTLESLLPALPADFPAAVLVAQHMPANFTSALAQRMDRHAALPVAELSEPTVLRPRHVWFAKGGADLCISRRAGQLMACPVPEDARHYWHPSVSRLVATANQHIPAHRLTGVMLTGMGYDGAAEMAALHQAGGKTIAEDESTAVVFGMPAELIRRGGANKVLPAPQIANQLVSWLMA